MRSSIVTAFVALGVWLLAAQGVSAAPDNVRVLYAQPFQYAAAGFSWDQAYIYVHVKNIGSAASRHVYVHYNAGSSWVDEELSLLGDYGDHSTYSVTHSGSRVEFVVKYVSSAGTYWDNNDNSNYKIQPWSESSGFVRGQVGYEVGMYRASVADYSYFTGTGWAIAARLTVDVAVENVSYNKQVGIRYSVDGGATWADAAGSFQYAESTGGGQRVEHWSVERGSLPYGGNIRFAVFYKNLDAGTESWDNNFYQDYALSLLSGNQIR